MEVAGLAEAKTTDLSCVIDVDSTKFQHSSLMVGSTDSINRIKRPVQTHCCSEWTLELFDLNIDLRQCQVELNVRAILFQLNLKKLKEKKVNIWVDRNQSVADLNIGAECGRLVERSKGEGDVDDVDDVAAKLQGGKNTGHISPAKPIETLRINFFSFSFSF